MADSINYQLAKFVASYGKVSQIPESTCPEVSFVGRSNVGKSSIMNKLFGRKNLVKVSSTPGKTSNINFFEADDVHFVDLPGYGFARRSKAERDRWGRLMENYFQSASLSATFSTPSAALTWSSRWWTFVTTPASSIMT